MTGTPKRLAANVSKSFQGSNLWGAGFVLCPGSAAALIERGTENAQVLSPYLTGKDLNDDPQQCASRWIINFFDWPLERVRQYTECFEIVEREVKPGRMKINRQRNRERWWIYGETRPGLYAAIAGLDRVLAISRVSKTVAPAFTPTGQVASEATVLFVYDDDGHFGLLSSAFHWWWAVTYASTMRNDLRYTPSDVFETFAQPEPQSGPLWQRIDQAQTSGT